MEFSTNMYESLIEPCIFCCKFFGFCSRECCRQEYGLTYWNSFYFIFVEHFSWLTWLKHVFIQIWWTLFTWMESLEPFIIVGLLNVVYLDDLNSTFKLRYVGHCLSGWAQWNISFQISWTFLMWVSGELKEIYLFQIYLTLFVWMP